MLYIKFQVPSSSGSLVLQPTKGVTDRRTDGQTVRQTDGQAQTNLPPQLLRSWGHKNQSAADTGAWGIIRGKKVTDSEYRQ